MISDKAKLLLVISTLIVFKFLVHWPQGLIPYIFARSGIGLFVDITSVSMKIIATAFVLWLLFELFTGWFLSLFTKS